MASRMIGRAACPECGFASAHVKQSEKCIYRYCPECGAQHHARTERQQADLMAKTRTTEPVATQPTPTATASPSPTAGAEATATASPTGSEATPTPTGSEAEAKPKRRGLFT